MKKLMCSVLALLTVFTCVGCRSRRDPNANTGDDYEVNLHPDTNVTATLRVANLKSWTNSARFSRRNIPT